MRRQWRRLAILVLLGCAAGLAGSQAWAWYHWRAARSALEHYHPAEARTHLGACLTVWPAGVSAHLMASRVARLEGAYEEAEEHLRACQRLQGGPSEQTVLEWALLRATMGDLDEVEDYLHERAGKDPGQAPVIWEALGEGYLRLYRIPDALACLGRWLEREPDNAQALTLRGNVWWQVKAPQKAVPDYRRVVELDPGRDEERWRLAICLLEVGRYDEALEHLEEMGRRRPGDPEVLVRLARCQNMLGRGAQARQMLDAVLAAHPDHGVALRTRGQIELMAGRPAEAESWLRRAVRVLPEDYQANWWLQEALRRQHKDAEARAQLDRAQHIKDQVERLTDLTTRRMAQRPRDPALLCELGLLLVDMGHREVGRRWLLTALHEDPDYQPAQAALARFDQDQGNDDRAVSTSPKRDNVSR